MSSFMATKHETWADCNTTTCTQTKITWPCIAKKMSGRNDYNVYSYSSRYLFFVKSVGGGAGALR